MGKSTSARRIADLYEALRVKYHAFSLLEARRLIGIGQIYFSYLGLVLVFFFIPKVTIHIP